MNYCHSVPSGEHSYLTILTNRELIVTCVPTEHQGKLTQAFRAGIDPVEVLTAIRAPIQRGQLDQLRSLEYGVNSSEIMARFRDPKSKMVTDVHTSYATEQDRDEAVREIQSRAGVKFSRKERRTPLTEENATTLIAGLWLGAILTVVAGLMTIFMSGEPIVSSGHSSRRAKALFDLLEALGPTVIITLGCALGVIGWVVHWREQKKLPMQILLTVES